MSWAWWAGTWFFCYPKTLKFSEKESGHRQVKEGFELETRYDTQGFFFFFKVFTSKHSDFSFMAIISYWSLTTPSFLQLHPRLAVIVVRTGTLCLGG